MYYEEYINTILVQRGRFGLDEDTYKERHHIKPRCLGGTNTKSNLIDLTAKEHYIAHKLLCEEYPDNPSLVTAWFRMAYKNHESGLQEFIDENEYDKLREAYSKSCSERMIGKGNPFYGKKHTQKTKDKISKTKTNPSKEIRQHLSEAQKKVDHSHQVKLMAEYNRTQRDYSKQGAKISATKQASGIGNGRSNKFKVTNGVINKFITPSEIDAYKENGFYIANDKQYAKYLRLLGEDK